MAAIFLTSCRIVARFGRVGDLPAALKLLEADRQRGAQPLGVLVRIQQFQRLADDGVGVAVAAGVDFAPDQGLQVGDRVTSMADLAVRVLLPIPKL